MIATTGAAPDQFTLAALHAAAERMEVHVRLPGRPRRKARLVYWPAPHRVSRKGYRPRVMFENGKFMTVDTHQVEFPPGVVPADAPIPAPAVTAAEPPPSGRCARRVPGMGRCTLPDDHDGFHAYEGARP